MTAVSGSAGDGTVSRRSQVLSRTATARRRRAPRPCGRAARPNAPRCRIPRATPQPPRRVVQRVLVGEAHRAVHLMRDRGAVAGGLADPHLGDRDLGLGRLVADAVRAIASAAPSAAAPAAATSPASCARLCCTAWNLAIGRPNWTRSSDHCTDWSRMCSSAPAICCARTAAPNCTIAGHVEARRRGDRGGARAVERDRVARLAGEAGALADRDRARRHQRHRRGAVPGGEHDDMPGIARERHLPRAAAQACRRPARYGRRRGSGRSSSARRALRSRPARAASRPSTSRRAAPARWRGRRRATPRTRRAIRPRRRRACRAPRSASDRDSSSASHSAFGHAPSSAALTVAGSHRSAKMRVAVSTMMLSVMRFSPRRSGKRTRTPPP